MSVDVPYLVTNRRLPELFGKIQSAAVPNRLSFEFLKKLGFASSNDRAFPSLLKKLGFVDPSGAPTDRYRTYRNPKEAPAVLAQAIRELYSELFAVDENVHKQSREHVRGVISRVTGMEEKYVNLAASTFRALCDLADFNSMPIIPGESSAPSVPPPKSTRRSQRPRHRSIGHLLFSFATTSRFTCQLRRTSRSTMPYSRVSANI